MKRPLNRKPRVDAIGRRYSDVPKSTGRPVELAANDIEIFKLYNRHGDLPVTLVFEYLKTRGLAKSFQATVRRHGVLFHEDNTPHSGPYLDRDPRQFETANSAYHCRVHRLTERGKRVLREEGAYQENTPSSSNSWKHDFLRACVSVSKEIACLKESDKYEYIPHHEIVNRIGKDHFKVENRILRPDFTDGIRYKLFENRARLSLNEIDCKTEQVKSTKKNPHNTFESKLDTIKKFIGGGLYKDEFGLSGGLMLQVVTVNEGHMHELIKLNKKSSYMLFSTVDGFDYGFVPPKKIFPLLTSPWLRPGTDDFYINHPNGFST